MGNVIPIRKPQFLFFSAVLLLAGSQALAAIPAHELPPPDVRPVAAIELKPFSPHELPPSDVKPVAAVELKSYAALELPPPDVRPVAAVELAAPAYETARSSEETPSVRTVSSNQPAVPATPKEVYTPVAHDPSIPEAEYDPSVY